MNVLILAPPSLEFPSRSLNLYERYVNIPIERNEEYLINKRYLNLIAKIIFLKRIGMKLIYCSFGTLSVSNAKNVIGFAHRLFSVLETNRSGN